MALAEVCGYKELSPMSRDNILETQVVNYSKNFLNNMDLALPPFPNVSEF